MGMSVTISVATEQDAEQIFEHPVQKMTEDYITGRYG